VLTSDEIQADIRTMTPHSLLEAVIITLIEARAFAFANENCLGGAAVIRTHPCNPEGMWR
jgi:hypothetical protein